MAASGNILQPNNWVSNYANELYSYAMSKTSKAALSEDLVQETFLSALKSRHTFKGQSSERTWLYSILKHNIANYYRKASTTNEMNISHLSGTSETPFEDYFYANGHWKEQTAPNNWQIDATAAFENRELAAVLDMCLANLPENLKKVVMLKLVEEEDTKVICKELNLSDTNYWILMHRAKLQLRACLEKNWINAL